MAKHRHGTAWTTKAFNHFAAHDRKYIVRRMAKRHFPLQNVKFRTKRTKPTYLATTNKRITKTTKPPDTHDETPIFPLSDAAFFLRTPPKTVKTKVFWCSEVTTALQHRWHLLRHRAPRNSPTLPPFPLSLPPTRHKIIHICVYPTFHSPRYKRQNRPPPFPFHLLI